MTVKGLLLAGVSVCAIGMGSAFAAAPAVHVTALRPGVATLKTAMHGSPAATQTATYSVSTAVSTASAYKTKTNLLGTFYTLNDSGSVCTPAKAQKVTLSKTKTKYARLSTGKVSYQPGLPIRPDSFPRHGLRPAEEECFRQDRQVCRYPDGQGRQPRQPLHVQPEPRHLGRDRKISRLSPARRAHAGSAGCRHGFACTIPLFSRDGLIAVCAGLRRVSCSANCSGIIFLLAVIRYRLST